MSGLMAVLLLLFSFFFFNDTATTEIYTLSLHDALPICGSGLVGHAVARRLLAAAPRRLVLVALFEEEVRATARALEPRSEEHTSELQSQSNLVCRLLLEKKKKKK